MHTDPELLSLFALGEHAGTADDRGHAETCQECAGELSELTRLVALARSVGAGTALAAPRQDVWTRIQDELALAPAPDPTSPGPGVLTPDPPEPLEVPRPDGASGTRSTPTPARRRVDFADEPTAHAQLAPVQATWSHASGRAELATDEHGRRLLQVALQADLPATGLRQAWLVHRDDPELRQSLGILDGQHGLWTVEHSIDLEQYAILDISQQDTGQTGHSGQTIVRGEFTLVS